MKKCFVGRRSFLKTAAAAFAAPTIITSAALGAQGRPAANERVVLGGIGLGKQGQGDLIGFISDKRVQVVAVCDVKENCLGRAQKSVNSRYGNQDCKRYVDYRELLARDDVDMIMCATPDHWHAQIAIDSMKSGKDVYCEKPLTLTIAEGRKIVDVARRYGRICSGGSQRVIGDYGTAACSARSGRFGKIVAAYANPGPPSIHCHLPGQPIPANMLSWDLWLGPAPWAPYHGYRASGGWSVAANNVWRSFYD